MPLPVIISIYSLSLYSMNVTMASVGTTVVAPSSPPSQYLFDAVDDLSKMYMSETWTGSIQFRCLPVPGLLIGLPLDQTSICQVDICDYLGPSSLHTPFAARLYLDPEKYDKPPLEGDPISKNPHRIQQKDALEAAHHTSGSPIMCNGGSPHNRQFKCKLRNRLYQPKPGKKDGEPRQDDCINMDKGGRRRDGRSQSKRTRTTQALTPDKLCPFRLTIKWDLSGFYITLVNKGGCPTHENHLKGDLSKLSLPMQLIPEKEKDILRSMSDACIGPAVGRNYVFSKLGKFITKAQIAYFASEPSQPLADGLKKSDTDSLLDFFEATADISYHTLWDVPLETGKTALISSLNLDREQGFSEIDHNDDPDFIEPRESAKISRNNP